MCAPTCRGGAYLAASVFIYRSLLLIVTAISCAITGYKMTYLNVPYLEEFMLHLIYFVPLFTFGGFILMGVEEVGCSKQANPSFNFVFFSTLALATTLFVRYGAELFYIYAFDWSAFRLKTPNLILNIVLDSIFILTLLIYAYQELRDPDPEKKLSYKDRSHSSSAISGGEGGSTIRRGKAVTSPGSPPGPLLSSSTPTNNSNIHNEIQRKNMKNSNVVAAATSSNKKVTYAWSTEKGVGIGHGARPGEALHYPITPVERDYQKKPLPALPAPGTLDESSELDDISLPPPIPLASPEYDYV